MSPLNHSSGGNSSSPAWSLATPGMPPSGPHRKNAVRGGLPDSRARFTCSVSRSSQRRASRNWHETECTSGRRAIVRMSSRSSSGSAGHLPGVTLTTTGSCSGPEGASTSCCTREPRNCAIELTSVADRWMTARFRVGTSMSPDVRSSSAEPHTGLFLIASSISSNCACSQAPMRGSSRNSRNSATSSGLQSARPSSTSATQ